MICSTAMDDMFGVRPTVQSVDGGEPVAVTPEGSDGFVITIGGGDYVAARSDSGHVVLYACDGGDPQTVTGLEASEEVVTIAPGLFSMWPRA